jgi:hypothetical protein
VNGVSLNATVRTTPAGLVTIGLWSPSSSYRLLPCGIGPGSCRSRLQGYARRHRKRLRPMRRWRASQAAGRKYGALSANVADPASVDAAAEASFSAFGKVHILCVSSGQSCVETSLTDAHCWRRGVQNFGASCSEQFRCGRPVARSVPCFSEYCISGLNRAGH